jgi:tellurite resistance protein
MNYSYGGVAWNETCAVYLTRGKERRSSARKHYTERVPACFRAGGVPADAGGVAFLRYQEVEMSKATWFLRGVALACALCAAASPAMAAKDPARWTQGDKTKAQRMATLKKEINAAYAEQRTACKRKSSGSRNTCLKEARQVYQHDMAHAPQLLAAAPRGEVTERVVATTPSTPDTPVQPGATAYGSSSTGATGAGAGEVRGKDDAVPPSNGQTSGLPTPRMDQSDMQAPNQPPQGATPPVQQQ